MGLTTTRPRPSEARSHGSGASLSNTWWLNPARAIDPPAAGVGERLGRRAGPALRSLVRSRIQAMLGKLARRHQERCQMAQGRF